MYKIRYSPAAKSEFDRLDGSVRIIFAKHLKKMETHLPQHSLKGGKRYSIEQVGQGRIACEIQDDTISVLHFFATHKEYEKWYKGL
jgi:mRNA-degrading endonuclease RelE of RelBE toxin-antitoxin system